jgi:hypothetical protein
MPILTMLSQIIGPLSTVIANLHTSDAEKLQIQNELARIHNEMAAKALEFDGELMKASAQVLMAEAQGGSWMQRSWRPITMFTFLVLVVCDSFGWLYSPLAPQAWTLLQIGLGGYVVGRSAEKIAPNIVSAMKNGGNE